MQASVRLFAKDTVHVRVHVRVKIIRSDYDVTHFLRTIILTNVTHSTYFLFIIKKLCSVY